MAQTDTEQKIMEMNRCSLCPGVNEEKLLEEEERGISQFGVAPCISPSLIC